ncbi:trehalose-phosphatase/synthase 9, TREHALOSE -6-PHOSPHATASE SYNTHASE S9 [Hibiscus trionum]|uniref:alpha,alpha-trehalose-phosphate synthase (UDP-forming) n=1 Tax=Hibiscus trionum TaxID=183268 RepID=A0A9W7JEP6_HIBTR|nr:trehalose-phosphatase/synthase 9, TREHALOSE -6-PHOSPHATASE SYNTHASE S9 [Hibiscus trionum]
MASRSCANFLHLVSGDLLDIPQTPRALPRVMTVPGIISDMDSCSSNDGDSDVTSSGVRERKIIVANMLPLHAKRDGETSKWRFSWDDDALLLHLKDGFSPETEVIYVGSLKVDIDVNEQEEVAQKLLEDFNCVPTFLPHDLQKKFYLGFCKQHLWPLFHYMLPMCPDHGDRFDRILWQAYVSANKIFADKVMEVINPDDDYVWIHDYHLMVLPTFLRKHFHRIKLGFFLHSPFPSSEIYRTLPVRDEILRGLLNCDLVGFHTFDYARHFLSCCSRMLGLDYESKRGHIGLDYFGRTVFIKILPVGIHIGRLESVLNLSSTAAKIKEIQKQFEGKKLILGIDDMDIFKGISLKLLAMEQLLQQHPGLQGKIVLVQIVNPARGFGKDVQEAKKETYMTAKKINDVYGSPKYQPVILIDRPVPRYEKSAYYALAECCIVNAVRDGMNLVPYKYIVCRQGTPNMDEALGVKPESPRTSMLVVSEFIGCSPSLSGAIRVNPWDIDAVAEALNTAITMSESEKQLRHDKHYRYVSTHDVAYWARSFSIDLDRACQDHFSKRCWGIGFGLGFRVVSLSPSFRRLSIDHIVLAYKRTNRRAIFLDYDGTVVPEASIIKSPSPEVISIIKTLCDDPKNTVFIVSGRGKTSLSEWLAPCEKLGIAAEHGYFIRWSKDSEWETSPVNADLEWKKIVEPVMSLYREATDGSNIEAKESALVWHHQDADPDFGSCQAKELLNHLESVLANEPAVVNRGQHIVEVKPQGVSKGLVAEKVLSRMVNGGEPPDFVMCVGDDKSDEDMFQSILTSVSNPSLPVAPEIFACTVGRKPSKAKYYLDDTADVLKLLKGLATATISKPRGLPPIQRRWYMPDTIRMGYMPMRWLSRAVACKRQNLLKMINFLSAEPEGKLTCLLKYGTECIKASRLMTTDADSKSALRDLAAGITDYQSELKQLRQSVEELESGRNNTRNEIAERREEELNFLKDLREQLNSIQSELRSRKPKEPPSPTDEASLVPLTEAMMYFWF